MRVPLLTAPQLFYNLCILFAVCLPIGSKINNIILIALALVWLYHSSSNRTKAFIESKKEFWLASGIFLVFAIGVFYSQNLHHGLQDLEQKLSLLAFPLILLYRNYLTKSQTSNIFRWFSYSCTVIAIYILGAGLVRYFQTNETASLFYHDFSKSVNMHAIFLSAYFSFAIFIIINELVQKPLTSIKIKVAYLTGASILMLDILLLSSKTILFGFLLISLSAIILFFYKKKKAVIGASIALSLASILILAILFIPKIRERVDQTINSNLSVLEQDRFEYNTEFTGLTIRLLFWKYAIEIINNDDTWLLGVGTGDSQDKLNTIYKEHNLYSGNGINEIGYQDYDTHNQFIETFLKLGLLGALYLLLYFFRNLLMSITTKNYLYFSFLLLFIIFSITETTLQANKGILFFAFFNCLFLAKITAKE